MYKYQGVVQYCIKRAKYSSRLFYLLKKLTIIASEMLSKSNSRFDEHIVVPVPLSRSKTRSRGFNQASVISGVVAAKLQLPQAADLLIRASDTKSQYTQSREQRSVNLRQAFRVSASLNGQQILLVDDVCTSGATFLEISAQLYAAGASAVSCFSLAKSFLRMRI